jgi:hypothetical protein
MRDDVVRVRIVLGTVFDRVDCVVSREVSRGRLDQRTALAVLSEFGRQMEKFDREFSERLEPRWTLHARVVGSESKAEGGAE